MMNADDHCTAWEEMQNVLEQTTTEQATRTRLSKARIAKICNIFACMENMSYRSRGNENAVDATFIPSFVEGGPSYIATAGPLAFEVEAFWDMVWDNGVELMVALAPPGKLYADYVYASHSFFELVEERESLRGHAIERLFRLEKNGEIRWCIHIEVQTWIDGGVPHDAELVGALVRRVDVVRAHQNKDSPVLVHCVGGLGRTGTFLCAHSLSHEGEGTTFHDVVERVCALRHCRSPHMVETVEQLAFLYQFFVKT